MRFASLLVCAFALSLAGWVEPAEAWPGPRRAYEPACQQETPERLVIEGEISEALRRCVEDNMAPTTREVVLNSPGGFVVEGARIAERLAGRGLTMRVRGHCASACASMLLPMASRIVVEPGALVMLHLGPDAAHLAAFEGMGTAARVARLMKQDRLTADAASARDVAEIAMQRDVTAHAEAFIDRHDIHPAWFLWRVPTSENRYGYPGLTGAPARVVRALGNEGWLLVEEPMMRSCLPGITIEPYQAELRRRWLQSPVRLGLIWRKIEPSGTSACAPPQATVAV